MVWYAGPWRSVKGRYGRGQMRMAVKLFGLCLSFQRLQRGTMFLDHLREQIILAPHLSEILPALTFHPDLGSDVLPGPPGIL
jgi:hypothetical protein